MKKLLAILFFVATLNPAGAQTCGSVVSQSIVPATINSGDSVWLNLQVYCYENIFLNNYTVMQAGNAYTINANYCHCCLQMITTTNDSIPIGVPPSGSYTYQVNVFLGNFDMGSGQCNGPFMSTYQGSGNFTVQNPNAILETAQGNFEIFPNPASGKVTVKSALNQVSKIEIYSLQGKLVRETENLMCSSQAEINVSEIESGFYLLKIYTKAGTLTRRLQIQ